MLPQTTTVRIPTDPHDHCDVEHGHHGFAARAKVHVMDLIGMVLPIVVLFVLLGLGVHIGMALGMTGLLGIFLLQGEAAAWSQLQSIPYSSGANYTLAVVPMFILMGALFTNSGYTADVFTAANRIFGGIRGGLPLATTAASGVFGAVTGSSVANAAVFSRVSLPQMVERGVKKTLAVGSIAASGTLASLIPPSLLLVVFGIITQQSVAALLVAGIIPGILSMAVYLVGIHLWVRWRPETAPVAGSRTSLADKARAILPLWSAVLVFGLVMGGIYGGLFTPTQAGAIGAFVVLVLGTVAGKSRLGLVWTALRETGSTTAAILLILVGGDFFSRYLGYGGVVQSISGALTRADLPPLAYLLIFAVIVVVLGMFLEAFSIMVLVLPVMFPVLTGVGYDPVWLGVVTIKLVEIGLITPPVGLNVYVVKSASPIPLQLGEVYRGVLPFLVLDVLTLALIIAFPSIVLFLPGIMLG